MKSATGIHFLREGLKRKYFSFFQLVRVPVNVLKYRMGFLKGSIVAQEISFMKGLTRDILEELGQNGFENYGIHQIFADAEKIIRDLQSRSERIILATSSFDYSVQPLADYFGIDVVIASSFEFKDGLCTGFIEGRSAFGESKKKKVIKYLNENGLKAEDCVFYSDSHHDLPLMEYVGTPIAVNPDRKLRMKARKNNWKIERFR